MPAFAYSPARGIERYAAQLPDKQKHIINSGLEDPDKMSPVYKNIRFLVRQLPENRRR